jgi:hypothetical protein
MAITNAQQYQQLVNKPADGKRPGYRGDDAARASGRSKGRSTTRDTTRSAPPSGTPRGDGPTQRQRNIISDESRRQQRQTTLPATATLMDVKEQYRVGNKIKKGDVLDIVDTSATGPDSTFQENVNLQNQLLNTPYKPINTPFVPFNYLANTIGEFGYNKNTQFFSKNSIGGKINPATGKPFGYGIDGYNDYMRQRSMGNVDAYGNVIYPDDDDDDQPIIPILPQDQLLQDQLLPDVPEEDPTEEEEPFELARRFRADGGIMNNDMIGGMMDGNMDEMGRQMYGLGKLVKKATRAVKKIVKSPIGKAALLYTGAGALGNLAGGSGLAGMFKGFTSPSTFLSRSKLGGIFSKDGLRNILVGGKDYFGERARDYTPFSGLLGKGGEFTFGKVATLASLLPFFGLGTGDESEEEAKKILDNSGISPEEFDRLRNDIDYQNSVLSRRSRAGGGIMRLGYQEGGDAEPVAKKTMPLLDMDGMEKDYRETGGFVEMGRMERADDVPARLSKNEFVFTADAVRNAGDGDIDKGAEVMYNMMKNLEDGGDVSEESQGLEGARKMFQTSQRLEEVL